MEKTCFFCSVLGKKDELFICENSTFFARYDVFPVTKGHSLIVPKKHTLSFFDLSPDELADFYDLIKKVREIVQEKYNPDAFNIGINEGREAGRTVDHLHMHLIPRYKGDVPNPTGGVRNIIPGKGDYTKLLKK